MIEKKYKMSGFLNWGAKAYRDHEVMSPPIYYKKTRLDQNSLESYLEKIKDTH
jgi:hypothetical protein